MRIYCAIPIISRFAERSSKPSGDWTPAPGPLTARNAHGGPVERPGFLFAHARIGLDLVLARLAPYDDADARIGGDT